MDTYACNVLQLFAATLKGPLGAIIHNLDAKRGSICALNSSRNSYVSLPDDMIEVFIVWSHHYCHFIYVLQACHHFINGLRDHLT